MRDLAVKRRRWSRTFGRAAASLAGATIAGALIGHVCFNAYDADEIEKARNYTQVDRELVRERCKQRFPELSQTSLLKECYKTGLEKGEPVDRRAPNVAMLGTMSLALCLGMAGFAARRSARRWEQSANGPS